eukprot:Pompholyxophrys_punicea_v1_NODE_137_length_3263_cov_59.617207.p3 type:complete len:136 gc:universal NODE_137_length_3263_cov_59.617207:2560-2967(+)
MRSDDEDTDQHVLPYPRESTWEIIKFDETPKKVTMWDKFVHEIAEGSSKFVKLLMIMLANLLYRSCLKEIAEKNQRVFEIQEITLKFILSNNKLSQYGRHYKFEDILNSDQFQQNLPLTAWKDYQSSIDRICKGC